MGLTDEYEYKHLVFDILSTLDILNKYISKETYKNRKRYELEISLYPEQNYVDISTFDNEKEEINSYFDIYLNFNKKDKISCYQSCRDDIAIEFIKEMVKNNNSNSNVKYKIQLNDFELRDKSIEEFIIKSSKEG